MRVSDKFLFILLILIVAASSVAGFVFLRNVRDVLEWNISSSIQANLLHSRETDYAPSEPVDIILVGDIMLSRNVGMVMESNGEYQYPFIRVSEILKKADITFGNLEGPISTRGYNAGSIYSFRANPSVVNGLSFSGFDVVSVANNHIWDWGPDALADTVSYLAGAGIKSVGAGADEALANKPAIFDVNGTKVGFLAYTTLYPDSLEAKGDRAGISNLDTAEERISLLDSEADVVVVSMHWGEEYEPLSNESQRALAHKLIDAGADIIVGHHPHVAQEIERYKDGWILYSLGNFVFDQSFSEETRTGLVAEATINGGRVTDIKTDRVYISETFQPAFVDL